MLKPLLFASSLLLVGCASSEQPKTVPWGENTPAQIERLKANDIEFTVKDGQVTDSEKSGRRSNKVLYLIEK